MGAGTSDSSNKKYASIIDGKFVQRLSEHKEGCRTRKLTKGDNEGKEVFEMVYDYIDGFIEKAEITEKDFGGRSYSYMEITLNDGDEAWVISLPTESRYAKDVMMKWPNVDFAQAIKFRPYRFEDGDKVISGFTILQDETKVDRHYTKDDPKDLPSAKKKKNGKWDFDDQNFFLENKFKELSSNVKLDLSEPEPSIKEQVLAKNAEKAAATADEEDDLPF